MPTRMIRPAWVKATITTAALFVVASCTPIPYPGYSGTQPLPVPGPEAQVVLLTRLGSDIAQTAPDTRILAASPVSNSCGPASTPVLRSVFPERVLFATASDQAAPDANDALTLLANRIGADAPGVELTVLGHTDAIGSDAYNMDLSRRRALSVLRALEAKGLAPDHLSAVAIGKRQPIADNDTPEGRARNRRVEFLISACLAANLAVVRAQVSSGFDAATPADVMRLDPSSPFGLAAVGQISLRKPSEDKAVPATLAPALSTQPPVLRPPASVARPAPAPHYQPRTLSPDAQQNPLGPAVPF